MSEFNTDRPMSLTSKPFSRRRFLVMGSLATLAGCAGRIPDGRVVGDEEPILVNESIFIPGGSFEMGHDSDGDHAPRHTVRLDGFYMDRYETTNAQYVAFCRATGRRMPEFWHQERYCSGPEFPNYPVIGISWYDARDYALWADKRLPTEAEWEFAARGGLKEKLFPWGDLLSTRLANYSKSEIGKPMPVGSYMDNGYGLFDMAGNVLEWVHDRYAPDYYAESLSENPWGPESGRFRVVRGGGWHTGPGCMAVHHRNALPSNWLDFAVGFRCARNA